MLKYCENNGIKVRSIGIDKQKCYVALHSDVYRKLGEPINVGCDNYNYKLVA